MAKARHGDDIAAGAVSLDRNARRQIDGNPVPGLARFVENPKAAVRDRIILGFCHVITPLRKGSALLGGARPGQN